MSSTVTFSTPLASYSPSTSILGSQPIVLVFFGPLVRPHLDALDLCAARLARDYGARIVGITAFWNQSKLSFPVISDDHGVLARRFQILDPNGGGVYPLDRIMCLDSNGRVIVAVGIENGLFRYPGLEVASPEETLVEVVQYLELLKEYEV